MKEKLRIIAYFNSLFLMNKDGTQIILNKYNPYYELKYTLNIFTRKKSICYGKDGFEVRKFKDSRVDVISYRREE